MKHKQLMRRYVRELVLAMIAYVIVLVASLTALRNYEFARFWQVAISVSPAVPVVFVVLAMLRALRNSFPKFPSFLVFPMLVAFWGISLSYFNKRYQ
jgi:amino acid permease